MSKAVVGVIGGSGVYALEGLEIVKEEKIASPWGEPSDVLRFGRMGSTECVFLARHGQGHRLTPSTINYRDNIDALKHAGVTDVIAISACGSFHRELYPGTFVLIDQIIDRTFARQTSFFGAGCVAHVPFAHPISPTCASGLWGRSRGKHRPPCRGTYICIEGPLLSTLAEWRLYQAQGGNIIGMTIATEAKLARRSGSLLRGDRHGHRLRLLVRRARERRRRLGSQGAARECGARQSARQTGAVGFPRRARALPLRLRPRARNGDHDRPGQRDPALMAKLDVVAGLVLLAEPKPLDTGARRRSFVHKQSPLGTVGVCSPRSLDEALRSRWRRAGDRRRDRYFSRGGRKAAARRFRRCHPHLGVRGVSRDGGSRVGGATTWDDRKADLPPAFAALQAAAREVGASPSRTAARSPAICATPRPPPTGVPPLLILDAEVELVVRARSAALAAGEISAGVRRTALARDEMLTAMFCPAPPPTLRSTFLKLGARRYLVISIVMVAAALEFPRWPHQPARVAVGACSPVAMRLPALEAALVGAPQPGVGDRPRISPRSADRRHPRERRYGAARR